MPTRPTELAEVPPTVAVALSYERGGDSAPTIVARGRGHLAEAILALAFEHGVKVREDADLAEMLAAVDIGDEIPFAAFSAVAEILAYIYRTSQAPPGFDERQSDNPVMP
jgi:flagellar biosynthesis protein